MQLVYLLLSVSTPAVYAALNGPCTGDEATGEYGTKGTCIPREECISAGGEYKDNACPWDPEGIKCCIVDSTSDDADAPTEPETQEPDTEEPETEEPDTEEPDTPEPESTGPDAPAESAPAPEPTESAPVQGGAGIATTNPIAALALGLAALAF